MVALNYCIDEVSWEHIRKEVSQLTPLLAELIDQVEPRKEFKLFRVKYPFGAPIFCRNQMQFPLNQRQIVPLSNNTLPKQLREQLSYSNIPLAFLLNKKIEIFTENAGKILPLHLINSGEFIGLYELFSPSERTGLNFPFQMVSGLRRVFFLSRIADGQSHRKLKAIYHIKQAAPKKLTEHWNVFREIIQSPHIECDWMCELLFISEAFINAIRQHPKYLWLKNYLMKMLWQQTQIWQNRAYLEVNWQVLSTAMTSDNFKMLPTDMVIIRRLLDIANGSVAGFRPAIDEGGLPISMLQSIYLNDYGLKEYVPIIMQPDYLTSSLSQNSPIYFSLLFPNQFYREAAIRQQSTLNELREIIQLNESLNYWLLKHNYFGFPKLKQLYYEYFHTDTDAAHKIRPTSMILQFDDELAKQINFYSNRKFPEKSPFLRGSVLILKNR